MSKEIMQKLAAPFPEKEIQWRVSRCGVDKKGKPWAFVLAYIDARAVMDRLDDVVGLENWSDHYERTEKNFLCTLSLRIGGEWISKQDGADETDVEALKGGLSGAFKRAAVKFGIGRYLYNLTENFAQIVEDKYVDGAKRAQTPDRQEFYWIPPALPEWAKPSVKTIVEAKPLPIAPQTTETEAGKLIKRVTSCNTMDELKKTWKAISPQLKKLNAAEAGELNTIKEIRKQYLTSKAALEASNSIGETSQGGTSAETKAVGAEGSQAASEVPADR